jgi:hypothetical protein
MDRAANASLLWPTAVGPGSGEQVASANSICAMAPLTFPTNDLDVADSSGWSTSFV